MIELNQLLLPPDFYCRLLHTREVPAILAVWWDPCGNELSYYALSRDGREESASGCSDSSLMGEIERLNPYTWVWRLGSGDENPEFYLVIDNLSNKPWLMRPDDFFAFFREKKNLLKSSKGVG